MDPLAVANASLKSLAGRIPVVGPVISGIFETHRSQLYEERLRSFLEDLREEASRTLEEEYAKDYLESQDFLHLVLLACEHAQRTGRGEKRRLYARALLNAGTKRWGPSKCDIAEEVLDSLSELSPTEIRVLQAAWEHRAEHPQPDPAFNALLAVTTAERLVPRLADLDLNVMEIRAYLGKLQRLGLTQEVIETRSGYSGGGFRLTPLFDRLMELIRVPEL